MGARLAEHELIGVRDTEQGPLHEQGHWRTQAVRSPSLRVAQE